MPRHWRARLNSSAAPLVLAKAAPDVIYGRAAKEPEDWGCAKLLKEAWIADGVAKTMADYWAHRKANEC